MYVSILLRMSQFDRMTTHVHINIIIIVDVSVL